MFRQPARAQLTVAITLAGVVVLVAALLVVHLIRSPGNPATSSPIVPATRASTSTHPSSTHPDRVVSASPPIAGGTQLWAKPPLGGIHQDQGTSIALPDGRTLWIFADTFQLYTQPRFFDTSTVAVTNPGSWELTYARTTQGLPVEFLPRTPVEAADRKDGDHYEAVWPTGATQLPDGRILISYAKYLVLPKVQNFRFLGAGLFVYRYRDLDTLLHGGQATRIAFDLWTAADGEVRSPVYADGYVYFDQCLNLQCYPVRSTPAGLTNRDSYQWWTGSTWSVNADRRRAIALGGGHPGGNASVVRLASGGYAMADTELGAVAGTGLLWVSAHPWGPWSRPVSFRFPRCPAPGCYGLNIHPSQSTASRIRIGYATDGVGPFVRLVDVPVSIGDDGASIRLR